MQLFPSLFFHNKDAYISLDFFNDGTQRKVYDTTTASTSTQEYCNLISRVLLRHQTKTPSAYSVVTFYSMIE